MFNVFFLMSQLDLEKPKRITGIITQGAKDFGVVQFVSAFKLAYSNDGQTWSIVKDQVTRTDKVTATTISLPYLYAAVKPFSCLFFYLRNEYV